MCYICNATIYIRYNLPQTGTLAVALTQGLRKGPQYLLVRSVPEVRLQVAPEPEWDRGIWMITIA